MKKVLSINALVNLVYFLFGFLPIVILGIIFFTVSPELPEKIKGPVGVAMWVFEGLALLGLIIQITVSRTFTRGIKRVVGTISKAREGDLTVASGNYSLDELRKLSQGVSDIIRQFHDVIANVFLSIEEVKHLTDTVTDTASQSAKTANEISASSGSVAKGASQQAGDAEVCSVISGELIQKVESVAHSSELMSKKADIVQDMAEFGKKNVGELMDKSRLSEKNIRDITERVNELSSMAQNVTRITEVITNIASQTNLLSLNAAIEAARAGEAGKGFAVVAEEIKKLADQSLTSVKDIVEIISGIQNRVNNTAETINAIMDSIMSQSDSVRKTNEAFNNISGAIKELYDQLLIVREGINQLTDSKMKLSDSIMNIASVAEETAASTEEMASLMYSQTNSGEILVQLATNLDLLIKGLDERIKVFKFNKEKKAKKSFAVIPCVDIPFFKDTFKGAQETGKKLGIDIFCKAPKKVDPAEQAQIIEEFANAGVSGIGLGPIDAPEVRDAVSRAAKKGVNVIVFDTDLPKSDAKGFIGTDNQNAGITVGETAAKVLNGKGTVIVSLCNLVQLNMKQRLDGFNKAVGKYPGIKVLEVEASGAPDIDGRVKELKRIIQKYPDFDCFVCLDSLAGAITEKITGELGIKPKCIGFDKSDDTVKLVKNGRLVSVIAQRPKLWGELVVRRLNDLMLGKAIPAFEDTGTFEINKMNVAIHEKN